MYAFRITWSELVFEASPSLSSRRHYDQEGLGRRPYKNLENFCLMINNLRITLHNNNSFQRDRTYFKGGGGGGRACETILGVKEGRPKIPSSFAVMASVSNAESTKNLPECQNHAFLTFRKFRFPTEAFPRTPGIGFLVLPILLYGVRSISVLLIPGSVCLPLCELVSKE